MEVAISTGLLYKRSAEEILDLIAEAGCRNVEICLNQSFMNLSSKQLNRLLEERCLKATSIHLPFAFLMAETGMSEGQWIEKCLKMAEDLGASLLVSHAPYKVENGERVCNEVSHKEVISHYNHVSSIEVTTENLPPIGFGFIGERYDELLSYLEDSNADLTYDVTHSGACGRDVIEDFLMFEPHVKNIHLSDFANGNEHKILGAGDLPLDVFLKLLKERDYKGLLTIELDYENKDRNAIESDVSAIRGLKDSLDFVQRYL